MTERGTLYVVGTPIGNLEDITHRAVRILGEVDLVAAEDTRTTKVLLDRYGIRKPMVSYHSHNERRRAAELVDRLEAGETVALVSDAGTPGISDPAFSVVREAINRGIQVVPVPGAAAFLQALVASGLSTDRFVFEGFLPHKKGRQTRIRALSQEHRTIVLYESPHRLVKTLGELLHELGDRDAVVARELTKKFEEIARGRLSELVREFSGRSVKGEFVLLVSGQGS